MAKRSFEIHEETFHVLGEGEKYLTKKGKIERVSPMDAIRFYDVQHMMNHLQQWEGYKLRAYKCTLTVRMEKS